MEKNKFHIIRTNRAGVFFAKIENIEGDVAELSEARRLWFWDGAASLSQLALEGVKRPGNCRFTVTVPSMTVLGVIEIIPCTDKAVASIEGVPVWKI